MDDNLHVTDSKDSLSHYWMTIYILPAVKTACHMDEKLHVTDSKDSLSHGCVPTNTNFLESTDAINVKEALNIEQFGFLPAIEDFALMKVSRDIIIH